MLQSLNEQSNYDMGEMKELAFWKVLSIYGPRASESASDKILCCSSTKK